MKGDCYTITNANTRTFLLPANTVLHVPPHGGITESERTGIHHEDYLIESEWNHNCCLMMSMSLRKSSLGHHSPAIAPKEGHCVAERTKLEMTITEHL